MIEKLEGFDKYLAVASFKNAKIKDVDEFFTMVKEKTGGICVQFFDVELIAGREHLCFATLNALNAFKNKINISSSLAMETLLYASARRQIKEAVSLLGIKPNSHQVAVLILDTSKEKASLTLKTVSDLLQAERDDSVIELSEQKFEKLKKLFAISNLELEAKTKRRGAEKQALMDLIIEHMALLATHR